MDELTQPAFDQFPSPPLFLNRLYRSEFGIRAALSGCLRDLAKTRMDASLMTGLPPRSFGGLLTLNDSLNEFAVNYSNTSDAFERIKVTGVAVRPKSLLAPTRYVEKDYLDSIGYAESSVRELERSGRRLKSAVWQLVEADISAIRELSPAKHKVARKFPRVLGVLAVSASVTCALFLAYAYLSPAWVGPSTFLADSLVGVIVNVLVALFAAALAFAVRITWRIQTRSLTYPWYQSIEEIYRVLLRFSQVDDVAAETAKFTLYADLLEEAAVAIQVQNPSADLAYWSFVVTRKFREFSTGTVRLVRSPSEIRVEFFAELRDSSRIREDFDEISDPATEQVEPIAQVPTGEFFDLLKATKELCDAAKSACCVRN